MSKDFSHPTIVVVTRIVVDGIFSPSDSSRGFTFLWELPFVEGEEQLLCWAFIKDSRLFYKNSYRM